MNENTERAQTAIEPRPERAGYWMRVSNAYAFVFGALLFVLPIFVIVFMAICAQAFTRNSVFGFGKDILSVSSFLSSDYKTVYYTFASVSTYSRVTSTADSVELVMLALVSTCSTSRSRTSAGIRMIT